MAFLDKLKFWKKDKTPDFGIGKPGDELGLGELGKDELGLPKTEQPTRLSSPRLPDEEPTPALSGYGRAQPSPSFQQMPSSGRDKDMEIALAKLDTIKALLDSLDHRMAILEQQSKQQKRSRYEYV